MVLVMGMFAFSFLISPVVSADEPLVIAPVPEVSFCCEKTTYGAWCQNAAQEECDTAFQMTPSGCDSTSYCRSGCCYDSWEGTCMTNSPQLVCSQNSGTWADSGDCEIPQCDLGCCMLADQAAFVTLVRCKKLSSFYGLQTEFSTTIGDEASCLALAGGQVMGACVFEVDYINSCRMTSKSACDSEKLQGVITAENVPVEEVDEGEPDRLNSTINNAVTGNVILSPFGNVTGTLTGNVTFYENLLCSAEELGTNCGLTDDTTCVEGKDEVYYVDSCGNVANIYDAARRNDKSYWREIIDKEDSCGFGASNANAESSSCGNCDYFEGSYCRAYDTSKDKKRPELGENICRDLNCYDSYDGNDYQHGETWCVYDSEVGEGEDLAGSRHWRHLCVNGEEMVEPCPDFRNYVCLQDTTEREGEVFQQAACRANRWQTCFAQENEADCLNIDYRDCFWNGEIEWSMKIANSSATSSPSNSGSIGSSSSSGSGNTSSETFPSSSSSSSGSSSTSSTSSSGGITGFASSDDDDEEEDIKTYESREEALAGARGEVDEDGHPIYKVGACMPQYSPGFDHWNPEGDAAVTCEQASDSCTMKFSGGLFDDDEDYECEDNCDCLEPEWNTTRAAVCKTLGDCTGSEGVHTVLDGTNSNIVSGTLNAIFAGLGKLAVYLTTGDMEIVRGEYEEREVIVAVSVDPEGGNDETLE